MWCIKESGGGMRYIKESGAGMQADFITLTRVGEECGA